MQDGMGLTAAAMSGILDFFQFSCKPRRRTDHGDDGLAFLDGWIEQAKGIGNQFFERLARTLDSHRGGLPGYFEHRISTGPLEGLNNKIKMLKRSACGFRDMEHFKLRPCFLHEGPEKA